MDEDILSELPGEVDSSLSFTLELEGEGLFDLEAGQLRDVSFEGSYEMTGGAAMDAQGSSFEAAFEMSGEATLRLVQELL